MPDPPSVSAFALRPQTKRARARRLRVRLDVSVVIAVGGAVGSLGRYAVAASWPMGDNGFPWATFVCNVSGCLLIGVLMVLIVEVGTAHRLLRPFLGVGVLGGYTTFSAYAVDSLRLLEARHAPLALGYLFGTLLAALLAVHVGIGATRVLAHRRIRGGG